MVLQRPRGGLASPSKIILHCVNRHLPRELKLQVSISGCSPAWRIFNGDNTNRRDILAENDELGPSE